MSDSKNKPSEFEQAMQQIGVAKNDSDPSASNASKLPAPKIINLSEPSAISDQWPVISHKDLEPEESLSSNQLSASLAAQSVSFHRGGLNQKALKRLQRGNLNIQQRIDLHGMTVDQSIELLNASINHIEIPSNSCVLIIHGKGYHSQGKPAKLKSLSERWCRAHPRVIAFCSATIKDGGTGAMYVLLRK